MKSSRIFIITSLICQFILIIYQCPGKLPTYSGLLEKTAVTLPNDLGLVALSSTSIYEIFGTPHAFEILPDNYYS